MKHFIFSPKQRKICQNTTRSSKIGEHKKTHLVEIGDKNRLKIRLKSALESEVTRSPQGP